jgi:5-methylcytosine-specific restriction protein B
MSKPVPVFSLLDEDDRDQLKAAIAAAYDRAGTTTRHERVAAALEASDAEGEDTGGLVNGELLKLPPFDDLIGIDPSVYRQIEAAVNGGKQHLMFYGPPGTGKTTLARRVAGVLNGRKWVLITGSADWSSQDIIGGYQPLANGTVKFFPGVLLQNFDRPLVIDELNRCDIDKVIGPLFTVLSGQATTLPYRTVVAEAESPQYQILPEWKENPAIHEFAPGTAWRLIATINSVDKASLYQMSYALSRRFGWIYVDAPRNPAGFVRSYVEKVLKDEAAPSAGTPPLAAIWDAVNLVRTIGPAPVIDAIKAIRIMEPEADLLGPPVGDLKTAYLDAFDLFFLPILDGILRHEAEGIINAVIGALALPPESIEAIGLSRRLLSVAI